MDGFLVKDGLDIIAIDDPFEVLPQGEVDASIAAVVVIPIVHLSRDFKRIGVIFKFPSMDLRRQPLP